MPDAEMTAMAEFYRAADREIGAYVAALGIECTGCGTCCQFDVADHVLYASGLERRYLLLTAPPPAACGDLDLIAKGLRCPYQDGNRCLARNGRTLGCRLHYCDALWGGGGEELAERWHRRLKALHDELGIEWRYAPLLPLPLE